MAIVIVLLFLATAIKGQCAAYCQNCQGPSNNAYNSNCQSCPNSFIFTSGTGSICTPDSAVYQMILEAANPGDLNLNNTSTNDCGSLFVNAVPGRFNSGRTIQIYSNTAMPAHYQVRVRGSALFVDFWDGTDKISYSIDNLAKAFLRYSNTNTVGGSSACGDSSRKEQYGQLDTNNQLHSAASLLVEVTADWCKCSSSGGGGCMSCSWMLPDIILMVSVCNETCLTCYGPSNTQCTSCANDTMLNIQYLLTVNTCDIGCGYRYYQSGPNICAKCNTNCTVCTGTSINCSVCATGFVFFPPNNTCPNSCPSLYYFNATASQCEACDLSCEKCTGSPSPCQYCASGYYLYQSVCYNACPFPDLVVNSANRTCENCSVWCVGLSLSFYQPSGYNGFSYLYIDLNFTYALDFSSFPMTTFQTISFQNSSLDLSMFNITYTPTNGNKGYRITLQPIGYSLIINQTLTVTTMGLVTPKHTSADGRPFKDQNYGISQSLSWTYLRPPDMTDLELSFVSTFSSFSTEVNNALTLPGLQEIKKLGFMLLLMNSLQITSCLLLVNIILPVNLYEGLRIFASLIFFDVPPWESESVKNKLFVVPPVEDITKRMLQQTGSPKLAEYRFRRTGFTNVFLVDCYTQIVILVVAYLVLLGFTLAAKTERFAAKLKPRIKYVYSALTSLHEIALMYFTLTIMFEFVYFKVSEPVRWVSVVIACLISLYYLLYHVHRYHELLKLPLLDPISDQYKDFVEKYGSLLKNIRYQEASAYGKCLPIRAYFQPQCYHVVSYVKKLLMMLAFPFFYETGDIVLGVLIGIQLLEIARFSLTWPFAKRWRNWLRLVLELTLLAVFIVVLVIQRIGLTIFGATPDPQSIRVYFDLGWLGFVLVMFFNFGFLFLCIYDLFQGYKFSNREMIDAIRRDYYLKKLNEAEHEGSLEMETVAECVKLGNLNNRGTDNLPEVAFRIEHYEITKRGENYNLKINNVMEATMTTALNFREGTSNIQATRRFEGSWRVNKKKNSFCYGIIHGCFENYAKNPTDRITIKTFSNIQQKKYKSGQPINLHLNMMTQQVEVDSGQAANPEIFKLDRLMPGFPIPEDLLLQLDRGLSIEIPELGEKVLMAKES